MCAGAGPVWSECPSGSTPNEDSSIQPMPLLVTTRCRAAVMMAYGSAADSIPAVPSLSYSCLGSGVLWSSLTCATTPALAALCLGTCAAVRHVISRMRNCVPNTWTCLLRGSDVCHACKPATVQLLGFATFNGSGKACCAVVACQLPAGMFLADCCGRLWSAHTAMPQRNNTCVHDAVAAPTMGWHGPVAQLPAIVH